MKRNINETQKLALGEFVVLLGSDENENLCISNKDPVLISLVQRLTTSLDLSEIGSLICEIEEQGEKVLGREVRYDGYELI